MMRLLAIFLTVLLLSGCIAVPEQLAGEYPQITPQDSGQGNINTRIRWGGMIIDTRPEEDQTCFEILSKRLDRSMRPLDEDQTGGRFIACKEGFLDPEVYTKGREVTLTGVINGSDIRKVGEFDYRYPLVNVQFLTLWEQRPDVVVYEQDWHYRPYYWHSPFYYSRPYPIIRAHPKAEPESG